MKTKAKMHAIMETNEAELNEEEEERAALAETRPSGGEQHLKEQQVAVELDLVLKHVIPPDYLVYFLFS